MNIKIKNQKGLSTLQTVVIAITVIICISFFVDLTNVVKKQQAVSLTSTFVSRTVAKQGGVRVSVPSEFMEKEDYINSADLYNKVKKSMNSANISDNQWSLKIKTPTQGTITIKPNTNLTLVDAGKNMEITLTVNYKWDVVSKVIPFNPNGQINSKRVATSTLKVRGNTNLETQLK
ncbi:MAG: hypothetical protein GX889_12470 [Clostridiales bacterium]|nr:hypothetical protein [Clostridiales bacterium]